MIRRGARGALLACTAVMAAPGAHALTAASTRPQAAQPASQADVEPARSIDELRGSIPDLQTQVVPPMLWVTPLFGAHLPYQIGFGVGADIWAAPWLRVGTLYSLGVSPANGDVKLSHYGEAWLGVRFLQGRGETVQELPIAASALERPVMTRAVVPAFHSGFVEGGALSGFIAPARCAADCNALPHGAKLEDAGRQLFVPFAGFRYVYFYSVGSANAAFSRTSLVQVYAHLLFKPVNAPDYDLLRWSGEPVEQTALGFRVGFDAPPFGGCVAKLVFGLKCAQGGVALGLNPTPKFVFFEFHLAYPID